MTRRGPARLRGQGGFTLIEIVIVLAIFAVLSSAVVVGIGGMTEKAHLAVCNTEKQTFEKASHASKVRAGDDIRNYLDAEVGEFFEASGATEFAVRPSSPFDSDCVA